METFIRELHIEREFEYGGVGLLTHGVRPKRAIHLAVQRGSNWGRVNAPADDARVELRPIYKPIILEILGQRRRLLSIAQEDEAPGYETEEAGEIL